MSMAANTHNEREVFSVAELNQSVRFLLESEYAQIWVEGEISNLAQPSSGHVYFSLKDQDAQVRCAMFRGSRRQVNFELQAGMQVLVRARVSLYAPRGDYQLIIEFIEPSGFGQLQRAFEALKNALAKQGLFDAQHKQALPAFPQCIGVITSPTGAAIRDVLSVLKRRFPAIPVIIYPTAVQGDAAAAQIVQAIEQANRHHACDVLLLTRGGGSLEDLWPFNEEKVAHAIYHSQLPIVSAVGHEIDFTIADFVADQRAPTPSAAAELISPEQSELQQHITHLHARLAQLMRSRLQQTQQQLSNLHKRLRSPQQSVQDKMQKLDYLTHRLTHSMQQLLQQHTQHLQHYWHILQRYTPLSLLEKYRAQLTQQQQQLQHAITRTLQQQQHRLQKITATLEAVSPLATLSRGYSITQRASDGKCLQQAQQVAVGEEIISILRTGKLRCKVTATEK
jgi:exodeoxyribonuclease VII large subunit